MGWRLGGKGASGRNAAHGSRIEEHGLHIWFGFYDNAFLTMRQCYEELARAPPTAALPDPYLRGGLRSQPRDRPLRVLGREAGPPPVRTAREAVGAPSRTWRDGPAALHLAHRRHLHRMDARRPGGDPRRTSNRAHPRIPHRSLQRFVHLADRFEVDLDRFDAGLNERLARLDAGGVRPPRCARRLHLALPRPGPLPEGAVVAPLVGVQGRALGARGQGPHRRHGPAALLHHPRHLRLRHRRPPRRGRDLTGLPVRRPTGSSRRSSRSTGPTRSRSISPTPRSCAAGTTPPSPTTVQRQTPVPDLAAGTGIHGILRLLGTYRGTWPTRCRPAWATPSSAPSTRCWKHGVSTSSSSDEVTELVLDDDAARGVDRHPTDPPGRGASTARTTTRWSTSAGLPVLAERAALGAAGGRRGAARRRDRLRARRVAPRTPPTSHCARGTDFDRRGAGHPAAGLAPSAPSRSPTAAPRLRRDGRQHRRSVMTQAAQIWTTRRSTHSAPASAATAIADQLRGAVDTYCDMSHLLARETWGDRTRPRGSPTSAG